MTWIREIVGWLLIGLGLAIFVVVYDFFVSRVIFEGTALAFVGIFVFRGGIHMLKVAVASRICREARDRLYPAPQPGTGPRPTAQARPAQTGTISRPANR